MPLPEQVTEHHHRLRVLAFGSVGRNQRAAQKSGHAEMDSGIARELNGWDVLRQFFVGGGEVPGPPSGGYAFEAFHLAQQFKLRPGQFKPVVAGIGLHHQVDHAIGAFVGVGIRQQAVDHAEDGSGGADTQRQRNDGRKTQAGFLAEFTEEELQVSPHVG